MASPAPQRCTCAHCRVRGLIGPVVLITVGVLFLISEYTRFSIADLWPVILIVIGMILVLQTMASRDGHTGP